LKDFEFKIWIFFANEEAVTALKIVISSITHFPWRMRRDKSVDLNMRRVTAFY